MGHPVSAPDVPVQDALLPLLVQVKNRRGDLENNLVPAEYMILKDLDITSCNFILLEF